MSAFTDAERTYLDDGHLGRRATVDGDGQPLAVPLGYRYNEQSDTIDIGGHDFASTRKFRNVRDHNPRVCLIVDDVAPGSGWAPRAVQIRGEARALEASQAPPGAGPIIRITPQTVVSWGLDRVDT